MNIAVCSAFMYFQTKEAVKGIHLLTYQILHPMKVLSVNWWTKGHAGSTSEVQGTDPFWRKCLHAIQGVSKILWQTSGLSSPHQNKEKVHTNICLQTVFEVQPPHLPDLNHLDFYLWGHLKIIVSNGSRMISWLPTSSLRLVENAFFRL
jgi:hypothetical protein